MRFFLFIFLLQSSIICSTQIISPIRHCAEKSALAPDLIKNVPIDTFSVNPLYPFNHFSVKEGLAQSLINTLFIDSKNRLWIGTYGGGASVYDGVTFKTVNKTHGLSNDIVWKFIEDDSGYIWMATDKGISIYNGRKFEYLNEKNGIENNYAWSIFKDSNNRIWIGTAGGGAYVYENGKIKSLNKPGQLENLQIYEIAETKSGDLVFATHGKGVWILKDTVSSNILFSTLPNDPRNTVRTLLVDSLNQIWCGTEDGLFILTDTGKIEFSVGNGLPSNRISDLFSDSEGTIWISTLKGVVKKTKDKFEHITTQHGLIDDAIKKTVRDKWGTVWMGTLNDGLSQLMSNGFLHFSDKNGFPAGQPTALLRDSKNGIWIGTSEGGPLYYDGKKFTRYGNAGNFKWSGIKSVFEDSNGTIWFGTSQTGVVKFDGTTFHNYTKNHGLISNNIWTIQQSASGDMWFGSQGSANRFDGENFFYYNENCGFAYYQVISSHRDINGNLWFGTFGGGATFIDGQNFYTLRDSHGLANNSILTISTDSFGNVWFSTYGEGISILRNDWKDSSENLTWKMVNIFNGLCDDNVKFIYHDHQANAWVGTNKGLNRINLNGENIFDTDPYIETFGYNEGFLGIECFLNGIVQDQENSFWISSVEMLSKFRPYNLNKQKVAPVVQLNSIKLELRDADWDSINGVSCSKVDSWNNVPENLELPHDKNHLQFNFIGICFDRPSGVEYQWKMEGFDSDWSPWSKTHEATYSNIPPGEFSFQIKARNADKTESEVFSYAFIIHKPFWQTNWFRSSVILFVIFSVWLTFRLRTRTLRRRQEFLEQTVTERTEELVVQKHIVDEKQKEIIDSITYAKRIQNAILVKEEDIQHHLKESFLLYLPKDIVAGDFYFFEVHNDHLFVAAADCTGHGVPGALVSVVCSNALTRSVKEFGLTDPGKILDKTRELIIETMRKSGETIRDGMDISFSTLSLTKPTLKWAGANNPLWIIRKPIVPLHEISEKQPYAESKPYLAEFPADKQPVGFSEQENSFTTQEINLEPGDRIYLFTDGFADQFGGPKGKKFKYKNLELLLCELYDVPFNEQKEKLFAVFNSWRGNLEQLDDVCIIGFTV